MELLFAFLAGFIAAVLLAKLADGGPCERLRARLFGGGRKATPPRATTSSEEGGGGGPREPD